MRDSVVEWKMVRAPLHEPWTDGTIGENDVILLGASGSCRSRVRSVDETLVNGETELEVVLGSDCKDRQRTVAQS